MRLFVFPLIAVGLLAGGASDEPSERQMKTAFEMALAKQVGNALDFVAEMNGEEAADHLREIGSDRFAIRSFRKMDCRRAGGSLGHVCAFAVNIELMTGEVERQMHGRFFSAGGGLDFADEV